MRIGIDIRSLSESHLTGVGEYLYYLLRALFALDKKNEYILFSNSFRKPPHRFSEFQRPNVRFVHSHIPSKILNASLFLFHFPHIDTLLGGVDLFFLPNHHFIALSRKCKKILTVHDLSFFLFPEFFSLKRRLWHRVVSSKKFFARADAIISVSKHTKNDLIAWKHLFPEKVHTIHSGVHLTDLNLLPPSYFHKIRGKYCLPDEYILSLGTLEPRKNLESIIEAYEMLCSSANLEKEYPQLVFAGQKGWKYGTILKRWKESLLKDRIHFIGYVEKEEKFALYANASVFVYPSFYEGFGFPPLEAMAAGTPVIASNVSSLPELIGNAGILVDPYNISELATALRLVLKDFKLCDWLKQEGMKRVQMFQWEACARKMLELFEKM